MMNARKSNVQKPWQVKNETQVHTQNVLISNETKIPLKKKSFSLCKEKKLDTHLISNSAVCVWFTGWHSCVGQSSCIFKNSPLTAADNCETPIYTID